MAFVRRLTGSDPANAPRGPSPELQAFAKEKLQLTDAIKPSVEAGLKSGAIRAEVSVYTTGTQTGTRVALEVGGKKFQTVDVGVVPGTIKQITEAGRSEAAARAIAMLDKGPKTAPEIARFTEVPRARLAVASLRPSIGGAGGMRVLSPLTMITGPLADYVEAGRLAKDPAVVREFVAALQDGRGVSYMAKLNPELDAAIRAELQRQTMRDI